MALIPSLSKPPAPPAKGGTKTKAKQRYLKAKKNRSKNRTQKTPTVAAVSSGLTVLRNDIAKSQSSDGDDSSSDDDEPSRTAEESKLPEKTHKPLDAKAKSRDRPKKKRKVDHAAPAESELSEMAVDEHSPLYSTPVPASLQAYIADPPPSSPQDEQNKEQEQEQEQQAAPLPTLPRFPLPRQPEAPSASVLYLQGVDEALIEAEIVDPAKTLPLNSDIDEDQDDGSGLSLKTRQRLAQLGILELFAVQTAILPFLLPPTSSRTSRSLYSPYNQTRDVCISAPTGSGKTLAYVLPIIETLSTRVVTRLRALVVLPTRDLVSQVRETFEALCKGRNLKIGMATGQHSFAQEQIQLVGDTQTKIQGGHSRVDILVCTPGRLMDHLQGTANFTLQHLRFLVIDEADRLVTEAFQDWLAQVLAATRPGSSSLTQPSSIISPLLTPSSSSFDLTIPRHEALHPAWIPDSSFSTTLSDLSVQEKKHSSCQKLLFSATLTRDPSKIIALNLHEPKYFVVGSDGAVGMTETGEGAIGETFAFPSTLKEHMLVCDSAQKPLMLLYLMHARGGSNALVFTKSAESTARLVKLIQAFEDSFTSSNSAIEVDGDGDSDVGSLSRKRIIAEAYSSDLSGPQRKNILERFRGAEIGILVCSDLISRGIDISHVSHVVSYDAPIDMRKYVHRVGRTARAGREGDAWSLVEEQEARHFKKMMSEASHLDRLVKMKVSEKVLEPLLPHYESALKELKAAFGR